MALVNVIPAASIYAVAVPGAPGKPAEVRLYDGNGDRFVATVIPFPGFEGSVNVAMGDVDGDGILDLIVGSGEQLLDRINKNPNDREAWNELAREPPPKAAKKKKPARRETR